MGTYNHVYVNSNAVGSLTINADHTLTSSVVGGGYWTTSGNEIALWYTVGLIWVGKMTLKGLNTALVPGTSYSTIFNNSGTWYATWK